jgi:hypothetical protein
MTCGNAACRVAILVAVLLPAVAQAQLPLVPDDTAGRARRAVEMQFRALPSGGGGLSGAEAEVIFDNYLGKIGQPPPTDYDFGAPPATGGMQ